MAEDFTARFRVDVSDLKAGLTSARKEIKQANAEFKASTAGMDSWKKDADGLSAKLKQLDAVLKQQKSILQNYQQQLKQQQTAYDENGKRADQLRKKLSELASQGVDKASAEYKKYESALKRVESEQERNEKAIQTLNEKIRAQDTAITATSNETQKWTRHLEQLQSEEQDTTRTTQQLDSATNKLEGGFTVLKGAAASLVADGLRKIGSAMTDAITSGAEYADMIQTMSSTTSLSTDTLQKLDYMSGLVDVDVNTVVKSMQRLTKSMSSAQGGSGAAADAFKSLGVEVVGTDGHLRDNEEVFYDVIAALGKIENETERDAKSMQLFGKSATELNPMIEAGAEKLAAWGKEAEEAGYIMDEDMIGGLVKLQDAFDRADRKMTAVKNTVAAGLAPALERGMQKVASVVDRVNWEKIGQQLGSAFEGIIDGFEWIIAHGDAVKAILVGIIAAFAAQKIAGVVQSIGNMTKALATMNETANANPYVLLISVIIGLGAALVSATQSSYEFYKQNHELIGGLQSEMTVIAEHGQALDDMAAAYDEARMAREDSMNAGLEEMAHIESLTEELATLADANGVVQESDQARAQFILDELNQALGTEYELTGNMISQYADLSQAVNDVIEKKRAEIVLQAEEEAYREAIIGRADAERELEQAIRNKTSAEEYMGSITDEIAAKQAAMNEAAAKGSGAVQGLGWEISMLEQAYSEAEAGLASYDESIQKSADVVNQYAYDIVQYETNATKAINGQYDQIAYKSWETAAAQGQASQEAANAVISNATTAQQQWLKDLGAMVTAATGKQVEFRDAGKGMVQAIVDGHESGKEIPVSRVRDMGQQMVQAFKTSDPEYVASGQNIPAGIAQGINSGSGQAYTAVTALASNILAKFNAEMQIKSPSKKMEWAALQTIEGYTKGIKKDGYKAAIQMQSLAKDITTAFNRTLLKETEDATDDYQRQIDKIISKNQKLYEDVSKLSTNLKKDIDSVTEKLKKDVASARAKLQKDIEAARNEYAKAVQSRYSSTMGQLGLTDILDPEKEGMSTDELKSNLEAQIEALEDWALTIGDLRRRIKNKELLKELEGIGVEDKETLNSIDSMTNKELAEFEKLYAKKQKLAKKEALQANKAAKDEMDGKISDLRKQANADIKTLREDADKQITSLKNQYLKSLKKLGVDVTKTSVGVGSSIAQGILTGFSETIKGAKGETATALAAMLKNIKKQLKINSPSGATKPFGQFLAQGIGVGFAEEMKTVNRDMKKLLPDSSVFSGFSTDRLLGASMSMRPSPGYIGSGSSSQVINQNYTQINNSPKPLSRIEIYRNTKNLLALVKAGEA